MTRGQDCQGILKLTQFRGCDTLKKWLSAVGFRLWVQNFLNDRRSAVWFERFRKLKVPGLIVESR